MPNDLYGETYLSYRDVARKLITIGLSKPFYRLIIGDDNVISYYSGNKRVSLHFPGIYAIYREDTEGNLEALYSGHSNNNIASRIYRFIKELQGRSRPDEAHYAAKKARQNGVRPTDRFMIKVLPKDEIPDFENFYYDIDRVDECIAHLLKTKYNERLIYD
jgi:hypothetical protein